jgi:hypothetical protein
MISAAISFIFLSFTIIRARDPFRALPDNERQIIAEYIRKEHGGEVTADSVSSEIIPYVPRALDKIARRLEEYVEHLENDGDLP